MPLIGTLNDYIPNTTIVSADVEQDFSDIRTAFNNSAVLTDVARTIAVTHQYSAEQDFAAGAEAAPGIYLNSDTDTGLYHIGANNLGIAAGGSKVVDIGTAGVGVTGTVTSSGAMTVTAGGLTVSAGGAAITGAVTMANSLTVTGQARFNGGVGLNVAPSPTAWLLYAESATDSIGGAQFRCTAAGTTRAALQARASTGHVGDVFEVVTSAGATLFGVDVNGNVNFANALQQDGTSIVTSAGVVQNITMDAALLTENLGGAGEVLTVNAGGTAPEWATKANQIVYDGWALTNIAASYGPTPVQRYGSSVHAFGVSPTRGGSVTAIIARLQGTISAGSITFEVYINDVATGLTVTFTSADGTNPVKRTTQASGTDTFSAGDTVDFRASSTGTLSPTTIDLPYGAIEVSY